MSHFASELSPHAEATQSLLDGLQKLQHDDTVSDFTIAVDGREWKVHKFVLAIHSDVLFKMSTSPEYVESRSGVAHLKEIAEIYVSALVEWFYVLKYELPFVPENYSEATAFHLEMSRIADLYNVSALEHMAWANIRSIVQNDPDFYHLQDVISELDSSAHVPEELWEGLAKDVASHIFIRHHVPVSTLHEFFDAYQDFGHRVLKELVRSTYASPPVSPPLRHDNYADEYYD